MLAKLNVPSEMNIKDKGSKKSYDHRPLLFLLFPTFVEKREGDQRYFAVYVIHINNICEENTLEVHK